MDMQLDSANIRYTCAPMSDIYLIDFMLSFKEKRDRAKGITNYFGKISIASKNEDCVPSGTKILHLLSKAT